MFALHAAGTAVLSAGKDGAVALSRITPTGLRVERSWAELCGGGVVKTCRWRPDGAPAVFAAAGRHGALFLLDARAPAGGSCGGAAPTVAEAHPRDVHCVRWQPAGASPALLLSAGYDPVVRLWDTRRAAAPVAELSGHVAPGVLRQKKIHQPEFCAPGGRLVAASGEGVGAITLFCAASGTALGRSDLGAEPSAIAASSCGDAGSRVAVACGRRVVLYHARAPAVSPDDEAVMRRS